MQDDRRQEYEAKLAALNDKCQRCIQQNHGVVDYDRCEMHCITGDRIRALDTQYSDITGATHSKW